MFKSIKLSCFCFVLVLMKFIKILFKFPSVCLTPLWGTQLISLRVSDGGYRGKADQDPHALGLYCRDLASGEGGGAKDIVSIPLFLFPLIPLIKEVFEPTRKKGNPFFLN